MTAMWNMIIGGLLGVATLFGMLWIGDRVTGGDGKWWK